MPASLILLRFALGPLLLLDARDGRTGIWFGIGLIAALLSDIYDGIIARKLGVATAKLREADSWVDGWFCCWVAACAWIAHREIIIELTWVLVFWFATDSIALIFDWIKFRRFASYHAYSAKLAGLLLFLSTFALFVCGGNLVFLTLAFGVATLSHLERLAISVLLPRWTPDVPSCWHALGRRASIEEEQSC